MVFCSLVLGFAVVCAQLCSTHAVNPIMDFKSCLPSLFPVHFPGTETFANLSTLSFRTDLSGPPAAIVLAMKEADISKAVRCARHAGMNVCARSGGHSLAGYGLCSGVLIDVGNLRQVVWDNKRKVSLGAGLSTGEALWKIWRQRKRWMSGGVCPGIGIGGYILGGGHGPYEGRLSIACDSVLSYRMINRKGKVIIASARRNRNLFWAMCGAGGGQFGIVTQFQMKTKPSKPIDNSIVFRFTWPREVAGELYEKYMASYNEQGGQVWFRMAIELGKNVVIGYGACYKIFSRDPNHCVKLLEKAEFFNTKGRKTEALFRTKHAPDTHAFFGPEGGWSRKLAKNPKLALIDQRYVDRETGNGRIYKSSFLKFNVGKKPGSQFWQKVVDFCIDPGRESIPWSLCEFNNFQNNIRMRRNNAFAFREVDVIQHCIVGGGSKEDQMFVYNRMKALLQPYTVGIYVNYPELELSNYEYPRMYWGNSLDRLKKVKKKYNPDNFFFHPQPIPS